MAVLQLKKLWVLAMNNLTGYGVVQRGSSLLEVMISLLILGVGLLGMLALQVESIKYNQQAYSSTQALFVANDIVEQMRMRVAVLTGPARDNPTQAQVFTAADWTAYVQNTLPGGEVAVTKTSATNAEYKITITYDQQVLENDKSSLSTADAAANKKSVRVNYVLFARL